MAILTYPLNGVLYDAEDAETYLCTRTSGVFASDGHFPASVTGNREVTIGPGLAWMQNEEFHGKAIYNPENVSLAIAEADAYQTRIDRIVLRFDKLLNMTSLMVLQGTPGQGAPDIERDSLVYDLGLYTVNVGASKASLSQSDVSSTMLDESVCGIMEDAVTSIPTQELYDQWYDWFSNMQADTETMENQFNIWFEQIKEDADTYMTETKNSFEVWMNGEKVDFDTWFDTVQDTLDSDTAGKLTNLVNDAQDTADEALEQLITGTVRGFMTEEYEGGEYGLQADDSDDSHAITLSKNICDCEGNDSASMDMISDEFNETHTYSEGDYCIYENTLFKFTADKSAGSWDWSCVQETNVGTELSNKVSGNDSGWITAELTSQFNAYSDGFSPKYRKIGSVVQVTGHVTPTSTIASTTSDITIFTLPEGYRPLMDIVTINQGSGYRKWQLRILTTGEAGFSRYGLTSGEDCSAGTWLPFSITFIATDSDEQTISPQGFPDDDDGDDSRTAPGPEIIDPGDDGDDNPDDDDTKTAPGPEIIDPDDENPDDNTGDDGNTGTLEPGEIIPDDGPDDETPAPDNPEEVE